MGKMKEILMKILAFLLALLVFYFFLCVSSAIRLERQVERVLMEFEKKEIQN